MQAGERAELKARQLEAAVEQARQRLAQAEQQLHAWRQGAEGERRTGAALATLEAQGWAVLHDLPWPGRPFANIDHIAVGPTGVYVIDSKNWSGRVEVRQGVLRQNGFSRDSDCQGAAGATAAVAAFLEPQHRSLTTAVLCLVDQPTPAEQPASARVVGLDDLVTTLTGAPPRMSIEDVRRMAPFLRDLLDGSRSPEQKTTAAFAGLASGPMEPAASRRGAGQRAPSRGRRSTPSRRTGPVRRSGGRRVLVAAVQLVLIAVTALYVAPRAIGAFVSSFEGGASRTTPTVTPHPTTGSTVHRTTPRQTTPRQTTPTRSR